MHKYDASSSTKPLNWNEYNKERGKQKYGASNIINKNDLEINLVEWESIEQNRNLNVRTK